VRDLKLAAPVGLDSKLSEAIYLQESPSTQASQGFAIDAGCRLLNVLLMQQARRLSRRIDQEIRNRLKIDQVKAETFFQATDGAHRNAPAD